METREPRCHNGGEFAMMFAGRTVVRSPILTGDRLNPGNVWVGGARYCCTYCAILAGQRRQIMIAS